ncbi:MAG: GatB/YqeY domain-containing protein, partial [Chloroflexota bacterium]
MTLRERIEADIRDAMRRRDAARRDALRFLKSQIQLADIAQGKSLDDSAVAEVIARQVKDRRESIRMFEQGHRADLVAKESAEASILEEYLPARLSADELVQLVQGVIKEVGASGIKDKG